MYDQQQHEMELETAHPSGAEEWVCHTCGRRFLMQWPPEYKKIVLVPGDEYAIHNGSKGGLHIGSVQVAQEDPALEEGLRPWLKGLESAGLDDE
jgi:hypothetical protein